MKAQIVNFKSNLNADNQIKNYRRDVKHCNATLSSAFLIWHYRSS